jgi:hypothetical protein
MIQEMSNKPRRIEDWIESPLPSLPGPISPDQILKLHSETLSDPDKTWLALDDQTIFPLTSHSGEHTGFTRYYKRT